MIAKERRVDRTTVLLAALAALSLLLALVSTLTAYRASKRSAIRYLACVEVASETLSRCPPDDTRAVLARTETAWTVARYHPETGWVTTHGTPVRSRVLDWSELPDGSVLVRAESER